jgi:hypothetical protein
MGPAQWIFLASMVALDFTFGLVAKPLLQATGIGAYVKLEMMFPAMLWALTRLTLDRFGICTIYQVTWAGLSMVLMPMAVFPGPLKLIPMAIQGLILDGIYSGGRRFGSTRVLVAALCSGVAGSATIALMRVFMGLPWAKATQIMFGFQTFVMMAIHLAGATLALAVWRRVRDLQGLRLLRVAP